MVDDENFDELYAKLNDILNSTFNLGEGVFDDEITSTEIAYLAKHFQNFLKNNNRRARN